MKNKYLYSRLVYSMAYVCAVAIFAFSRIGIPNDVLIAFALTCLVTGGWINASKDDDERQPIENEPPEKMSTISEEMEEARALEEAEK
jgi:hypothetical protein